MKGRSTISYKKHVIINTIIASVFLLLCYLIDRFFYSIDGYVGLVLILYIGSLTVRRFEDNFAKENKMNDPDNR